MSHNSYHWNEDDKLERHVQQSDSPSGDAAQPATVAPWMDAEDVARFLKHQLWS